jgi:hypothetical protein
MAATVILALIVVWSGPAQAWYSPVNVWEQSAPPAAPGLFGSTRCLILSMDGNIYGTAFAKAMALNSYCATVRSVVVYGSSAQLGPSGPVVGCCNVVSQSSQSGSGVVGGYFYVTTIDFPVTIVTVTSVFQSASAVQTSTLSADGSATTTVTNPIDSSFDQAMARGRAWAPKPWYPADVRATLVGAFGDFTDCMRANAVTDFPAPPVGFGDGTVAQPVVGGPSGSDLAPESPVLQRALTACAAENEALRAATLAANGR